MTKKDAKPKEPKPWDRRPWPESGDRNQEKLYAAVGRAISEWERYEAMLAFLFANFLGSHLLLAGRRAYSAVRTFEGRTAMLRAASEAYFYGAPHPELLAKFKTLLTHATKFSEIRNEIVHGVVDHYRPEPPAPEPRPALNAYALFPAYASVKDRDPDSVPGYCYTSVELEYFRQEFFKLRNPAHTLAAEISVAARAPALRGKLQSLYRK